MKERPILFSGDMVRAILDGRKTQTRRIAKPRFHDKTPCEHWNGGYQDGTAIMARHCNHGSEGMPCPYGQPGDRLWVKETFRNQAGNMEYVALRYRADDSIIKYEDHSLKDASNKWKWRPSIFMPRWASRITLEITGVRVQRLQDISEEDAIDEGVEIQDSILATAKGAYCTLWESINGKGSWSSNPWVWAIEFKRL